MYEGTSLARPATVFAFESLPQPRNDHGLVKTGDDEFDAFWALYPLHREKVKARQEWKRAIKKVPLDIILNGAAAYAAERNGCDPHYTLYPERWLKRERWDDEPLPRGKSKAQIRNEQRQANNRATMMRVYARREGR